MRTVVQKRQSILIVSGYFVVACSGKKVFGAAEIDLPDPSAGRPQPARLGTGAAAASRPRQRTGTPPVREPVMG